MSDQPNPAGEALRQAYQALRQGDRRAARRWAERAAALAPEREDPWLILAALAAPEASLKYLQRALAINPGSRRARQGMHWAARRLRQTAPPAPLPHRVIVEHPSREALTRRRPAFVVVGLPLLLALLLALVAAFLWTSAPLFSDSYAPEQALAQVGLLKATRTPTATATFTPTPTFTPTATSTATPTPTETPTPTSTPTSTPTETPEPTEEPTEEPPEEPDEPDEPDAPDFPGRPPGVGKDEPWIDIDLTRQKAYAYQGNKKLASFVVSTGTWQHPTVTGAFQVYVKYRFADMAGPGYYLPDVPNVMYFYKDYGLHGTYWHNNFGTPMSHGCVNFSIPDSDWIYDFVSVGTVVNVHD